MKWFFRHRAVWWAPKNALTHTHTRSPQQKSNSSGDPLHLSPGVVCSQCDDVLALQQQRGDKNRFETAAYHQAFPRWEAWQHYVSDGEVCCTAHNTKTILSHILCSARLRGYQDILCVTKSDVVLNSSAPSSNSTIPHPSRKTNHMWAKAGKKEKGLLGFLLLSHPISFHAHNFLPINILVHTALFVSYLRYGMISLSKNLNGLQTEKKRRKIDHAFQQMADGVFAKWAECPNFCLSNLMRRNGEMQNIFELKTFVYQTAIVFKEPSAGGTQSLISQGTLQNKPIFPFLFSSCFF